MIGGNNKLANIVVALPWEAAGLCHYFGLDPMPDQKPFRCFQNDRIALIVSGPGIINAAAATAFLYAVQGDAGATLWINIGIAGHANVAPGHLFAASEVLHTADKRVWRLNPPQGFHCAPVRTVATAECNYPEPALYDIEATAFCQTCVKFQPKVQIQVLKVVSDNRQSPVERLSKTEVTQLMEDRCDEMEAFLVTCQ